MEKDIRKAQFDRSRPNNFCKKEIEELQTILSDLNKREAKFLRRNKWKLLLNLGIFKFLVFLGFYTTSIPQDAYNKYSSFYLSLGLVIYLFLVMFLLIYYRAFMTFFYKALAWTLQYPEKEAKKYRFYITLILGSFFLGGYGQLVVVCAVTIPKFFSPALPITTLSILNGVIQALLSAPVSALVVIVTLGIPLPTGCATRLQQASREVETHFRWRTSHLCHTERVDRP